MGRVRLPVLSKVSFVCRNMRWPLGISALALTAITIAIAPAAAQDDQNEPIRQVQVNGEAPGRLGVGLDLAFTPVDDVAAHQLAFANPASNAAGNIITQIEGTLDSPTVGFAAVYGPENETPCDLSGPPGSSLMNHFFCEVAYPGGNTSNGTPPGGSDNALIVFSDPDYRGGLDSVNVIFNQGTIGACAGEDDDERRAATATAAAKADRRCTPPSRTRITEANTGQNPPTFAFTARRAKRFMCTLWRNGHIKFRHGCTSPKAYDNPLQRGHYVFTVSGVNKAGFDSKQAAKSFVVK